MMKNYMTMGTFAKGKKLEGTSAGKATTPFPEEKAVMSIYGVPAPHESHRMLKLTSRAVNAMSPAALGNLRWSESPITFNQMDHWDSIPKPGRFPLIVDPLVGMTWLTKALMDGGSSLNRVPRHLPHARAYPGSSLEQPAPNLWSGLRKAVHPSGAGHPVLAVIKWIYLPPAYLHFIQDIEDRCLLLMSSMSFVDLPFQEHQMTEMNHVLADFQNPLSPHIKVSG
jgi:hypothetical protein